jgi:two-component system response regulator YesN
MINVLVADDEFIIREFLETLLDWNLYNMQVIGIASDGEIALEMAKKHSVDILITDLNMPYLSGLELITQCKLLHPNIKCFVLSGYDDFSDVSNAYKLGVQDYFLKADLDICNIQKTIISVANELSQSEIKLINDYERADENQKYEIATESLNESRTLQKSITVNFGPLGGECPYCGK